MKGRINFLSPKNEKGFVLVVAIFIVAILMILTTSMLTATTSEYKIGVNMNKKNQSYYAAEAAVSWLTWEYKQNGKTYLETDTNFPLILKPDSPAAFDSSIGSAEITKISATHFEIKGYSGDSVTTLNLEVIVDDSKLKIQNWHEH